VTTLDDFTPEDLDRAAAACAGLPLPPFMPEHFPSLLAESLAPLAPGLAAQVRGLPAGELEVLYDFLLTEQEPRGAGLALTA
jgi:hypothetical protein